MIEPRVDYNSKFLENLLKVSDLSPIQYEATVEELSQWFKRFSNQTQDSKMYSMLSKKISEDSELLRKIPNSETQPVPNLFLASVNYLLAKNLDHDLANFYPNYEAEKPFDDLYQTFRNFCFLHINEIETLMSTRLVQTNEAKRCALLLPTVSMVSTHIKGSSLHLIDVGTSTGLNLLMDQYFIRYSDGISLGNKNSPVEFTCETDGEPLTGLTLPIVATRTGIDLNPIDLTDEDEFLWTLSLIWPDQGERIDRFKNAVAVLRKNHLTLKKGNVLDLLIPTIEGIPIGSSVCVMHSFTLNQFSNDDRANFETRLAQASLSHDIWRISLEWIGTEHPKLMLERYIEGKKHSSKKLATCHQHGAWIHWVVNLHEARHSDKG